MQIFGFSDSEVVLIPRPKILQAWLPGSRTVSFYGNVGGARRRLVGVSAAPIKAPLPASYLQPEALNPFINPINPTKPARQVNPGKNQKSALAKSDLLPVQGDFRLGLDRTSGATTVAFHTFTLTSEWVNILYSVYCDDL